MTRSLSIPFLAIAAALALAAAAPAHARNDTFMLPVSDAIHKTRTREIVGDLPLRFGAATAPARKSHDILQADVVVEGIGSTGGDDPRQHHLGEVGDNQRCILAFEDALAKLVVAARDANAGAIVGIVSDYKGEAAIPDGNLFECHAGGVRSYVWLHAQLVRSTPSARELPPASGFADLADADAVPLGDEGKERYRHFLTLPSPRAFVVFEDGHWYMTWKDPEATSKALDHCARVGKRCWLYAADDRVVWTADAARRIGSSAQLQRSNGVPAPAVASPGARQ
jgi:hypothetical protein